MGEIRTQRPVVLLAAVSSRYQQAIDEWTVEACSKHWGKIALQSELFDFNQTKFYEPSMGTDIKKRLFAFETLLDPANLPNAKILANELEQQYKADTDHAEERPLNIDPGYVTEAKLVLATTKDRDHRIYLRDGIFAEITLFYKQGVWERSRWTYADYLQAEYHAFFSQCRDYLRSRYASDCS